MFYPSFQMSKYFTFLSLITLSIIIISINCHSGDGTIITFQSKETIQKQLISEIIDVSYLWNLTSNFTAVSVNSTWDLLPENIIIANFTIKHVELNFDNLVMNYTETDDYFKISLSGDIFKVVFNFGYSYHCIYSGQGTGEASVSSLNQANFERIYIYSDDETERHVTNITANVTSDFKDLVDFKLLVGDYSKDVHVTELANSAFRQLLLTEEFKSLAINIDAEFDKFYLSRYFNKVFIDTKFPDSTILLNYATEHVPIVGKQGNGTVVFYYDGEFQDLGRRMLNKEFNIHNDEDSKLNHPQWNNFNLTDGSYQLFIHQNLIGDMYKHLSQVAKMSFAIENADLPNNTEYQLNIGTLGQIYPNILNELPSDTLIKLLGFFDNFRITTTGNHFVVTCTMHCVTYTTDDIIVFIHKSEVQFTLTPVISTNQALNFMNLNSTMVLNSSIPPIYSGVTLETLNNILENVLDKFNERSNYSLFKTDFPLYGLFEEINLVKMIEGEGLLIAGEYRQRSVHLKNVVKRIEDRMNSLSQSKLKYLK